MRIWFYIACLNAVALGMNLRGLMEHIFERSLPPALLASLCIIANLAVILFLAAPRIFAELNTKGERS